MIQPLRALLTLLWLSCGVIPAAVAQSPEAVFPADAGLINVKAAPYNAKGDGTTDDTEALKRALTDYIVSGRTLYLPTGTYLVSDALDWPSKNGFSPRHLMIQGQSRTGTVIRLRDNAAGFQDPQNPKALMRTGCCLEQAFNNSVRNLTLHVGSGNAGAVGLDFFASNQGIAEDLDIVSGDGTGRYGLHMSGVAGPQTVRNVAVRGFDVGVHTVNTLCVTLENITVENQNQYGVENRGAKTALRKLTSVNAVPAVYSHESGVNSLVLLDSDLRGTGAASTRAAIIDEAGTYVRNVTASGYALALDRQHYWPTCLDLPAGLITEYTYPGRYDALFATPNRSLGLPVKEVPTVPWDAPATWANVVTFGADASGQRDATAAVQAAINSGATTVYFPSGGFFRLDGTVELKGNLRRLMGNDATVHGTGGLKLVEGAAADAPVVVVERLHKIINGAYAVPTIEHASNTRTLALTSTNDFKVLGNGRGDLFLTDFAGQLFPNTAGQHIWARQFNTEYYTVPNRGAHLWILGMKGEGATTLIHTYPGGKTEAFCPTPYPSTDKPTGPMFVNDNADVSLIGLNEINFNGKPYDVWVREIRNGQTRDLLRGDVIGRPATSPRPNYDNVAYYSSDTQTVGESGTGTGLLGEYFADKTFTDRRISRVDRQVNFIWSDGTGSDAVGGDGSPGSGIGKDNFVVRWTGQVQPRYSGTYTFSTASDDGVRLWVNGQLLIDQWRGASLTRFSGQIALQVGQKYDIKLEYLEEIGYAAVQLYWASDQQPQEIIPACQLYAPGTVTTTASIQQAGAAQPVSVYPNPLPQGVATLRYFLAAAQPVGWALYDLMGRVVKVSPYAKQPAGVHEQPLDLGKLPAGPYVLHLTTGTHTTHLKLQLR